MMNMNKIIVLLLSFVLVTSSAMAASVDIKWTDPDKYRDIHQGNDGKKSFRKNLFHNFEKHFTKLASKLPEGQVLKIEVTDIDLAGSTLHGGISRIRVIKDNYPPRMDFSYQLMDVNNNLILEDEVKLKNMSFMMGSNLKYRNSSLGYEKEMIDKWFSKTFEALLKK